MEGLKTVVLSFLSAWKKPLSHHPEAGAGAAVSSLRMTILF